MSKHVINGVPKREIPDAQFRMVESAPAERSATMFGILCWMAVIIFGVFFFYLGIVQTRESLPQNEVQEEQEEQFVPDMEYLELLAPSPTAVPQEDQSQAPRVNQRELRRSVLVYLDEAWAQANTD